MEDSTQKLADMVTAIKFETLPKAVVHEAKRVLLDSIGCAIAGVVTDKGKYSVELARRLAGPAESTILGTGDKVSCSSAAFANGELINALDWDALLVPGHVTPFVIPAPLALAESNRASGKDLIVATVLGHEVSARMSLAMTPMRSFVAEGPEWGKVEWHADFGYGPNIFGGVIGAGKVLHFEQEEMLNAVGLAGHMCPISGENNWMRHGPTFMYKYGSPGWVSLAATIAALLSQIGYTGNPTVLDGEYGFWRCFGSERWEPEALIGGLGEKWHFLTIHFKPYPACGCMHTALDCLISIIEKNDIKPEEIEHIDVLADPIVEFPNWYNRDIETHIDAQFKMAYSYAVAANRVKIAPEWQDLHTITDPKIIRFMDKISVGAHPDYGKRALEDKTFLASHIASVEVKAGGKVFREERKYAKGIASPEEFRMTDDELIGKFRNNISRTVPWKRIDRAVESIMELERIEDVSKIFEAFVI